jgi:hypothetical protein
LLVDDRKRKFSANAKRKTPSDYVLLRLSYANMQKPSVNALSASSAAGKKNGSAKKKKGNVKKSSSGFSER